MWACLDLASPTTCTTPLEGVIQILVGFGSLYYSLFGDARASTKAVHLASRQEKRVILIMIKMP
jgi:hypothetical protein